MSFCKDCQAKFNGRLRTWYFSTECQDCGKYLSPNNRAKLKGVDEK